MGPSSAPQGAPEPSAPAHSWRASLRTILLFAQAVALLTAIVALIDLGDFTGGDEGALPGAVPGGGATSGQFEYQLAVEHSRSDLFDGDLYATTNQSVTVANWFPVEILLCGPDSGARCPKPNKPPEKPGASVSPAPTDKVRLGARVGVRLTAADDAVTIDDSYGDELPVQTVTERADVARWIWDVQVSKPGDYLLRATVYVLAADTDIELVPRETVDIRLTVKRTASYTAARVTSGAWGVTQWLVSTAIAFLGTGLITAAGIAAWWRRRRRRATAAC